MDSSSTYRVTIKSANQKVDDYVTSGESNWTVKRLKQHISETHVNKPNVEDQRLIYAGNLLKDTHTLKQVFFRDSLCTDLTNSDKTDFTIHLVCTQKSVINPSNSQTSSANVRTGREGLSPSSSSTTTNTPSSPSNSSSTRPSNDRNTPLQYSSQTTQNGLNRNASTASSNASANSGATNLLNNIFSSPSVHSNISGTSNIRNEMAQHLMQSEQMQQQLALFQQLANLVAAQIVTYAQNGGTSATLSSPAGDSPLSGGPVPRVHVNVTSTITNADSSAASRTLRRDERQSEAFQAAPENTNPGVAINDNEENNNNNDNNANAPAIGEQAAPQFRLDDARVRPLVGAPPVIEQAHQNDLIDWVYCTVKAVVLMAAIFLHASIFRILFIFVLLAIAYFFNRRLARRPTRRETQDARPQPPDNNQRGGLGGFDPAQDRVQGGNSEDSNTGLENQAHGNHNNITQGRIPFLKFCYLVVTDFITSLLPE